MVTAYRTQIIMTALLLCLSSLLQAANLTATLDRNQLAIDETVRLSLRLDQRSASGHPDLSLLEPYFEVLGRNKSTQIRSINGQTEAWTQWDFTLAPKVAGRILIPAFEFAGAQSQPLQVEVSEAQSGTGTAGDYFLQLHLDRDQAYPGQQVIARLRLHTAVRLGNLEIQPFEVDGADVVELTQQQYQKQVNGRSYLVYELNYAIFPRQPGTLKIDRQRLQALKNPSRSLFDTPLSQPVRLSSEPAELEVLPLPPQVDTRHWLAASSLTLSQTLSEPTASPTDQAGSAVPPSRPSYRVGEPITRTLVIEAQGLQSNQLPALTLSPADGFRQYDEPAQLDQQTPSQGLYSSRTETYALVPTRPGTLTLPAVELSWWDTLSNSQRIATLPERRIEVVAASSSPALQPPPPVPASQPELPLSQSQPAADDPSLPRWWWLSQLLWATLCLGLALLWWRARRQPSAPAGRPQSASGAPGQDEQQAFKTLCQCCQRGDAQQIRQALQRWLHCLAQPPGAPALVQQIEALDRSLYSPTPAAPFDPQALLQAVTSYRRQPPAGQPDAQPLAPLYPDP